MGFIRKNQNIVIWIDGLCLRLIKFLDQCEDEAGIPMEFLYKIIAAGSNKLACFRLAQKTAIFKSIADLFVQFISVG